MIYKSFDHIVDETMNFHGVDFKVAEAYARYVKKIEETNQNKGNYKQDGQKTKTYQAEWAFERSFGHRFPRLTLEEMNAYSERVFNSKVWKKHEITLASSKSTPTISFQNRNTSNAWYRSIAIGPNQHELYTLLHELAHTNGHRNHGPSFRACLVDFVREFMGEEFATALSSIFKENKLPVKEFKEKKIKPFDKWIVGYKKAAVARKNRFGS